jgi:hypothetical protein
MTPSECAKYLGVKQLTLALHRIRGSGPPFAKHGGKIVYYKNQVAAWSEERTNTSVAEARLTRGK